MEVIDLKGRKITLGDDVIFAYRPGNSFPSLGIAKVTEFNEEENKIKLFAPANRNSIWSGNTPNRFMKLNPPLFMVGTSWEHIWSNGDISTTRWVRDMTTKQLTVAQHQVTPKNSKKPIWENLNPTALNDLDHDVTDNIELEGIRFGDSEEWNVYFDDEVPEWANSPAELPAMV